MTDQDGVSVFRENIAAFNRGDIEAFSSSLADNGSYRQIASNDIFEGKDAWVGAVQGWKSAFPDMEGKILTAIQSGDKVAATVRWTGTHTGDMVSPGGTIPATGKSIDAQSCFMNTISDGKFTDSQNHFDMMTLLRQIGVIE